MKKMWKKPFLEVLDVNMTMKWWGDGGSGAEPEQPDPDQDPNPGIDS